MLTRPPMAELWDFGINELGPLLSSRKTSPVEVLGAILRRIEDVEPEIHAFISIAEDKAQQEAKASERRFIEGSPRSPLDGIPIALKDNISTAGLATTAGSKILASYVPKEDATVVERLRSAGAVILGKTNLHEFAGGATTDNPHYGPTRNPWDRTRIPGGSSGGSGAAVAARECFGALGTDAGGSIRIPAALNGVSGIRPTFGRVSNAGVLGHVWSCDAVGPICRSVQDCALILEAIAGPDERDPSTAPVPVPSLSRPPERSLDGCRLGVIKGFTLDRLEPSVEKAIRNCLRTLEALGATVTEVTVPHIDLNETAQFITELSELASYHEDWLRDQPANYGTDVRLLLEGGLKLSATHYVQAQRYRTLLRTEFSRVFDDIDALVGVTTPIVAPPMGMSWMQFNGTQVDVVQFLCRFACVAPMAGLPAMSVPCGLSPEGLPIGLEVTGPRWGEQTVFRVCAAFEMATDWHRGQPVF